MKMGGNSQISLDQIINETNLAAVEAMKEVMDEKEKEVPGLRDPALVAQAEAKIFISKLRMRGLLSRPPEWYSEVIHRFVSLQARPLTACFALASFTDTAPDPTAVLEDLLRFAEHPID